MNVIKNISIVLMKLSPRKLATKKGIKNKIITRNMEPLYGFFIKEINLFIISYHQGG